MRDDEYPLYITEVSKLLDEITKLANEDEREAATNLYSDFLKLANDGVKDDRKLKEEFYDGFEKFVEGLQRSSKCYKYIQRQLKH